MKIFNAYTDFKTFGGAELLAINLTKGLSDRGIKTCILSSTQKHLFNKNYEIENLNVATYSYRLIASLNSDDVIISHHRKVTTKLIFLKRIFFLKFRIIHVAHNEFFDLKFLTFYPKEIIAVSFKVRQNLISYFNISSEKIKVIYNGIKDAKLNNEETLDFDKVKVLLPARINNVKQQVEIVKNLTGKLNNNIEIHFAGDGEDIEKLREITKNNTEFKVLGFVPITEIVASYDYVMLFSKVEGLPTVLIEACMHCKPIICNDVGGNFEILDDGLNGYAVKSYNDLIQKINSLPEKKSTDYKLLCEHSRSKYLKNFTFQAMLDNYYKLLVQC